MSHFDRRTLIKGGAALGLAGATNLLDFAKAWAQASPFKPEPNSTLNVLRWKRFVEAEDAVPGAYDSLLGKVHAWGPDRATACARLAAALDDLVLTGVPTTAPYLRAVLDRAGTLEQRMLRLYGVPEAEIARSLLAIEAEGVALDGLEITTCLRRGEIEIATVFEPGAAAAYDAFAAGIRARHRCPTGHPHCKATPLQVCLRHPPHAPFVSRIAGKIQLNPTHPGPHQSQMRLTFPNC